MITFEAHTLPGNDQSAFLRAEIEIERGRKVRQEPRVCPLNGKLRVEGTHRFRKLPRMAQWREIFKNGRGSHARVSIQGHLRLLAWVDIQEHYLDVLISGIHSRRILDHP